MTQKEEELTTSKMSSHSTSLRPKTILIGSFLSFLILCIFILSISSMLFILLQQNVISFIDPSRIYVPEGKFLYELHTMTYRNHTLYKYRDDIIILEEHEIKDYEEPIVVEVENNDDMYISNFGYNDEDIVVVMNASPYRGNKHKVRCEAQCTCYAEEGDDFEEGNGRRINWARFKPKFTKKKIIWFVVISIISWAIPKVYEIYEEECKAMALKTWHWVERMTCEVEEIICEEVEDLVGPVKYDCEGHCVTKYLNHDAAVEAAEAMECESKFGGRHIVEVMERTEEHLNWHSHAMRLYRKLHLGPYCKTFQTSYFSFGDPECPTCNLQLHFFPCVSYQRNKEIPPNIRCTLIDDGGKGIDDESPILIQPEEYNNVEQ